MNIYKYSVSQEKTIIVTECEVLKETPQGYIIKVPGKFNARDLFIKYENLEVVSKRLLYSTSPDKMDFYVSELKESFARIIAKYKKQASIAEANLKTILSNSELPLE